MRVLIAEDERSTARALKVLLEKSKFSVDIVHDGKEAWNYIETVRYDVIVLDIMMPGMSGLEVLSRIRGSHMATPVLLLTAKAEIEDRIAGLDAGADDYLPKPFASGELIEPHLSSEFLESDGPDSVTPGDTVGLRPVFLTIFLH